MNVAVPRLAVCICTYQRLALLGRLVADLLGQGRRPDALIVVDGDPASGQARSVLEESAGAGVRIVYQPSDHPNQPYQRYLGWRVAARESVERRIARARAAKISLRARMLASAKVCPNGVNSISPLAMAAKPSSSAVSLKRSR